MSNHTPGPWRVTKHTMMNYTRISKMDFYLNGGFANPRCVRVSRGKSWAYFWKNS